MKFYNFNDLTSFKCNNIVLGATAVIGIIGGIYLLTQSSRTVASRLADRKIVKKKKDEQTACNVCLTQIDTDDSKTCIACYSCAKNVCRGEKCSEWVPKDGAWRCQLCAVSRDSYGKASNWVQEQYAVKKASLTEFSYPMRARSEIYIPLCDPNESAFLCNFESVSEAASPINPNQKQHIRQYIEEVLAEMIGGSLDNAKVERISSNGECQHVNNGYDFHGVSNVRLRRLIESIIAETVRHPPFVPAATTGLITTSAINTNDSSNGDHEGALVLNGNQCNGNGGQYFESKKYHDLLATAVLNKIVNTHGNGRHSESSPDLTSSSILDNNHNALNLNKTDESISSSSSVEPRSESSLTDPIHIINKDDNLSQDGNYGNNYYDDVANDNIEADRESVLSDFISSHMVPLPHISADPPSEEDEDEEEDYISVTSSRDANWEDNWLFKKKKSTKTSSSVGMLVPAPKEDIRALIGDKPTDEVSDLSEVGSDTDDSSLEMISASLEPLNDRLVNKHLIGGKNTKIVLDEIADRTSMISTSSLPDNEPPYTETKNEFVVSNDGLNESQSLKISVNNCNKAISNEAINANVTKQNPSKAEKLTKENQVSEDESIVPPPNDFTDDEKMRNLLAKFNEEQNNKTDSGDDNSSSLSPRSSISCALSVGIERADLDAYEGITDFSVEDEEGLASEIDPAMAEESSSRRPSVIEILAAIALGPMLAVSASDDRNILTELELSSLMELNELAMAQLNAKSTDDRRLGVIAEESFDADDRRIDAIDGNEESDLLSSPKMVMDAIRELVGKDAIRSVNSDESSLQIEEITTESVQNEDCIEGDSKLEKTSVDHEQLKSGLQEDILSMSHTEECTGIHQDNQSDSEDSTKNTECETNKDHCEIEATFEIISGEEGTKEGVVEIEATVQCEIKSKEEIQPQESQIENVSENIAVEELKISEGEIKPTEDLISNDGDNGITMNSLSEDLGFEKVIPEYTSSISDESLHTIGSSSEYSDDFEGDSNSFFNDEKNISVKEELKEELKKEISENQSNVQTKPTNESDKTINEFILPPPNEFSDDQLKEMNENSGNNEAIPQINSEAGQAETKLTSDSNNNEPELEVNEEETHNENKCTDVENKISNKENTGTAEISEHQEAIEVISQPNLPLDKQESSEITSDEACKEVIEEQNVKCEPASLKVLAEQECSSVDSGEEKSIIKDSTNIIEKEANSEIGEQESNNDAIINEPVEESLNKQKDEIPGVQLTGDASTSEDRKPNEEIIKNESEVLSINLCANEQISKEETDACPEHQPVIEASDSEEVSKKITEDLPKILSTEENSSNDEGVEASEEEKCAVSKLSEIDTIKTSGDLTITSSVDAKISIDPAENKAVKEILSSVDSIPNEEVKNIAPGDLTMESTTKEKNTSFEEQSTEETSNADSTKIESSISHDSPNEEKIIRSPVDESPKVQLDEEISDSVDPPILNTLKSDEDRATLENDTVETQVEDNLKTENKSSDPQEEVKVEQVEVKEVNVDISTNSEPVNEVVENEKNNIAEDNIIVAETHSKENSAEKETGISGEPVSEIQTELPCENKDTSEEPPSTENLEIELQLDTNNLEKENETDQHEDACKSAEDKQAEELDSTGENQNLNQTPQDETKQAEESSEEKRIESSNSNSNEEDTMTLKTIESEDLKADSSTEIVTEEPKNTEILDKQENELTAAESIPAQLLDEAEQSPPLSAESEIILKTNSEEEDQKCEGNESQAQNASEKVEVLEEINTEKTKDNNPTEAIGGTQSEEVEGNKTDDDKQTEIEELKVTEVENNSAIEENIEKENFNEQQIQAEILVSEKVLEPSKGVIEETAEKTELDQVESNDSSKEIFKESEVLEVEKSSDSIESPPKTETEDYKGVNTESCTKEDETTKVNDSDISGCETQIESSAKDSCQEVTNNESLEIKNTIEEALAQESDENLTKQCVEVKEVVDVPVTDKNQDVKEQTEPASAEQILSEETHQEDTNSTETLKSDSVAITEGTQLEVTSEKVESIDPNQESEETINVAKTDESLAAELNKNAVDDINNSEEKIVESSENETLGTSVSEEQSINDEIVEPVPNDSSNIPPSQEINAKEDELVAELNECPHNNTLEVSASQENDTKEDVAKVDDSSTNEGLETPALEKENIEENITKVDELPKNDKEKTSAPSENENQDDTIVVKNVEPLESEAPEPSVSQKENAEEDSKTLQKIEPPETDVSELPASQENNIQEIDTNLNVDRSSANGISEALAKQEENVTEDSGTLKETGSLENDVSVDLSSQEEDNKEDVKTLKADNETAEIPVSQETNVIEDSTTLKETESSESNVSEIARTLIVDESSTDGLLGTPASPEENTNEESTTLSALESADNTASETIASKNDDKKEDVRTENVDQSLANETSGTPASQETNSKKDSTVSIENDASETITSQNDDKKDDVTTVKVDESLANEASETLATEEENIKEVSATSREAECTDNDVSEMNSLQNDDKKEEVTTDKVDKLLANDEVETLATEEENINEISKTSKEAESPETAVSEITTSQENDKKEDITTVSVDNSLENKEAETSQVDNVKEDSTTASQEEEIKEDITTVNVDNSLANEKSETTQVESIKEDTTISEEVECLKTDETEIPDSRDEDIKENVTTLKDNEFSENEAAEMPISQDANVNEDIAISKKTESSENDALTIPASQENDKKEDVTTLNVDDSAAQEAPEKPLQQIEDIKNDESITSKQIIEPSTECPNENEESKTIESKPEPLKPTENESNEEHRTEENIEAIKIDNSVSEEQSDVSKSIPDEPVPTEEQSNLSSQNIEPQETQISNQEDNLSESLVETSVSVDDEQTKCTENGSTKEKDTIDDVKVLNEKIDSPELAPDSQVQETLTVLSVEQEISPLEDKSNEENKNSEEIQAEIIENKVEMPLASHDDENTPNAESKTEDNSTNETISVEISDQSSKSVEEDSVNEKLPIETNDESTKPNDSASESTNKETSEKNSADETLSEENILDNQPTELPKSTDILETVNEEKECVVEECASENLTPSPDAEIEQEANENDSAPKTDDEKLNSILNETKTTLQTDDEKIEELPIIQQTAIREAIIQEEKTESMLQEHIPEGDQAVNAEPAIPSEVLQKEENKTISSECQPEKLTVNVENAPTEIETHENEVAPASEEKQSEILNADTVSETENIVAESKQSEINIAALKPEESPAISEVTRVVLEDAQKEETKEYRSEDVPVNLDSKVDHVQTENLADQNTSTEVETIDDLQSEQVTKSIVVEPKENERDESSSEKVDISSSENLPEESRPLEELPVKELSESEINSSQGNSSSKESVPCAEVTVVEEKDDPPTVSSVNEETEPQEISDTVSSVDVDLPDSCAETSLQQQISTEKESPIDKEPVVEESVPTEVQNNLIFETDEQLSVEQTTANHIESALPEKETPTIQSDVELTTEEKSTKIEDVSKSNENDLAAEPENAAMADSSSLQVESKRLEEEKTEEISVCIEEKQIESNELQNSVSENEEINTEVQTPPISKITEEETAAETLSAIPTDSIQENEKEPVEEVSDVKENLTSEIEVSKDTQDHVQDGKNDSIQTDHRKEEAESEIDKQLPSEEIQTQNTTSDETYSEAPTIEKLISSDENENKTKSNELSSENAVPITADSNELKTDTNLDIDSSKLIHEQDNDESDSEYSYKSAEEEGMSSETKSFIESSLSENQTESTASKELFLSVSKIQPEEQETSVASAEIAKSTALVAEGRQDSKLDEPCESLEISVSSESSNALTQTSEPADAKLESEINQEIAKTEAAPSEIIADDNVKSDCVPEQEKAISSEIISNINEEVLEIVESVQSQIDTSLETVKNMEEIEEVSADTEPIKVDSPVLNDPKLEDTAKCSKETIGTTEEVSKELETVQNKIDTEEVSNQIPVSESENKSTLSQEEIKVEEKEEEHIISNEDISTSSAKIPEDQVTQKEIEVVNKHAPEDLKASTDLSACSPEDESKNAEIEETKSQSIIESSQEIIGEVIQAAGETVTTDELKEEVRPTEEKTSDLNLQNTEDVKVEKTSIEKSLSTELNSETVTSPVCVADETISEPESTVQSESQEKIKGKELPVQEESNKITTEVIPTQEIKQTSLEVITAPEILEVKKVVESNENIEIQKISDTSKEQAQTQKTDIGDVAIAEDKLTEDVIEQVAEVEEITPINALTATCKIITHPPLQQTESLIESAQSLYDELSPTLEITRGISAPNLAEELRMAAVKCESNSKPERVIPQRIPCESRCFTPEPQPNNQNTIATEQPNNAQDASQGKNISQVAKQLLFAEQSTKKSKPKNSGSKFRNLTLRDRRFLAELEKRRKQRALIQNYLDSLDCIDTPSYLNEDLYLFESKCSIERSPYSLFIEPSDCCIVDATSSSPNVNSHFLKTNILFSDRISSESNYTDESTTTVIDTFGSMESQSNSDSGEEFSKDDSTDRDSSATATTANNSIVTTNKATNQSHIYSQPPPQPQPELRTESACSKLTETRTTGGNEEHVDDDPLKHLVPGSIAEREYKKWYNAVDMPNNPYSVEALRRRLSGGPDRALDLPNISPCNEENPLLLCETTEADNKGPERDYSRYSRDYYINDAKQASGTTKKTPTSPVQISSPTSIASSIELGEIIKNTAKTTETLSTRETCHKLEKQSHVETDIYLATPVQVIEEDIPQVIADRHSVTTLTTEAVSKLSSETSSILTNESLTPSEDSDTIRIYDLKKQETRLVKETTQTTTSTTTINLNVTTSPEKKVRPSELDIMPTPIATISSKSSTPTSFKFLQPKRKLINPSQVLSIDQDNPPITPSPVEKPVIEAEVAHAMPSVKALAKAFLLTTSSASTSENKWRKARAKSPLQFFKPTTPTTTAAASFAKLIQKQPEPGVPDTTSQGSEDATIASDLSSLETDPPSRIDGDTLDSNAASQDRAPSPVVLSGCLRNNIAFFENLKNK